MDFACRRRLLLSDSRLGRACSACLVYMRGLLVDHIKRTSLDPPPSAGDYPAPRAHSLIARVRAQWRMGCVPHILWKGEVGKCVCNEQARREEKHMLLLGKR